MDPKNPNLENSNYNRFRHVNERDVVELVGYILTDPRISANAALAAIAILQNIDFDSGRAIVSDKALYLQTASKTDSRKLGFARERLRRTKWMVWTTLDFGGETKFVYVFPSLGRLKGLQ